MSEWLKWVRVCVGVCFSVRACVFVRVKIVCGGVSVGECVCVRVYVSLFSGSMTILSSGIVGVRLIFLLF